MPSPIYTHPLTVPPSAIDANGHANNIEYLRWFQDAAIAHADSVGCTTATRALNATWVVRSHHITYLRPALLHDQLLVKTWIATLEKISSTRRYQILRTSDNTLLAEGSTDWILIDATTLRPKRIPEEITTLFTLLPDPPTI